MLPYHTCCQRAGCTPPPVPSELLHVGASTHPCPCCPHPPHTAKEPWRRGSQQVEEDKKEEALVGRHWREKRHKSGTSLRSCSLDDFNVAFGSGDVQSRGLGVWVRSQGTTSFQHRHGILKHDPLLLFSGLVHVDSCDANKGKN